MPVTGKPIAQLACERGINNGTSGNGGTPTGAAGTPGTRS